jgi:parvulin-like peptidyl-prolyl isomerase
MRQSCLFFLLITGLSINSGCDNTSTTSSNDQSANSPDEVIATVGEKLITATEIKAKLNEQSPHFRARYKTPERKKEFVENLVRFEVMLQEARKRDLENDPEVKTMFDRVLVQRLVKITQQEFENTLAITDADAKKYYDEHQNEFVRPARIRVNHIFIASLKTDPKRGKIRETASKMLAEIKAKEKGKQKNAFIEYASSRSEDTATKQEAGDLGFKTKEELTQIWGELFATAAFNLKTIGELAGVIETDKGFHLLKLSGRQNGMEQSFDTVKSRIQSRLSAEKRTRSLDEFISGLKSKANVTIDEKKLSEVNFDLPPATSAAQ